MIENNPPGQLLYALRWKMKEAGFSMLTPMDDGSYLIMWLPAVTDKEDKRGCRINRTKREPLIVKDWEYPIYRGKTMSLYL